MFQCFFFFLIFAFFCHSSSSLPLPLDIFRPKNGPPSGVRGIEKNGIRPICRLHFGQKCQNFPSFIVKKWPRKNGLQNVPKIHFLLSLILLRFPPKKAKCVVSARKSRQQIGLKAKKNIYIYICNFQAPQNSSPGTEQLKTGKTRPFEWAPSWTPSWGVSWELSWGCFNRV